jgi:hypothetical protein
MGLRDVMGSELKKKGGEIPPLRMVEICGLGGGPERAHVLFCSGNETGNGALAAAKARRKEGQIKAGGPTP